MEEETKLIIFAKTSSIYKYIYYFILKPFFNFKKLKNCKNTYSQTNKLMSNAN